jgi:hypothetical protein
MGVDCARGFGGLTLRERLAAVFIGPGDLSFWYRCDGGPMGWSRVSASKQPEEYLSATIWTKMTKRLPIAGPQTVYWWAPSSSWTGPANFGYLDEVTFVPDPPEIAVDVHPSLTPISNGGGQTFGNVVITAASRRSFNIRNTGTVSLTGLAITIDGANAADFLVTSNLR